MNNFDTLAQQISDLSVSHGLNTLPVQTWTMNGELNAPSKRQVNEALALIPSELKLEGTMYSHLLASKGNGIQLSREQGEQGKYRSIVLVQEPTPTENQYLWTLTVQYSVAAVISTYANGDVYTTHKVGSKNKVQGVKMGVAGQGNDTMVWLDTLNQCITSPNGSFPISIMDCALINQYYEQEA